MRKKVFAFLLILSCLFIVACSNENEKKTNPTNIDSIQETTTNQENVPKQITISKFKDSDQKIVISDKVEVKRIYLAIKNAVQLPGIVDMAEPHFRIIMGEELFFLWLLDSEGTKGTIMNANNTHTIYSLSESITKELQDRLLK